MFAFQVNKKRHGACHSAGYRGTQGVQSGPLLSTDANSFWPSEHNLWGEWDLFRHSPSVLNNPRSLPGQCSEFAELSSGHAPGPVARSDDQRLFGIHVAVYAGRSERPQNGIHRLRCVRR